MWADDSDYLTYDSNPQNSKETSSSQDLSSIETELYHNMVIPKPPFHTPPKLRPVEEVMGNNTGTDVASLRQLTTALAREAIFGREEMARKSLSGRRNTQVLSEEKLKYIKTLVRSRVSSMSQVEFEYVWTLCRALLSKWPL